MPQKEVDIKLKKALSAKYEIIREVGSGGMAVVYQAVQKTLDRTVALKVVHQNFVHDREFIQRFIKEARVAASLNHPNIITIHDVDSIDQYHYMTMEYLEGEPLSERIRKKGKLGIAETLKIVLNVAKALHYLHRKGYIHRDVKSSNIFVTNDNRAVLMDFGIVFTSESMLSQPGTVLGTPEFMSPEQANGNELSGKSDLYSLGVIMYECLTAQMPFRTDNPLTTVYKVINEAPKPVSELNDKVPEWLNSQILNLLSKNPDDRIGSGKDLAMNIINKTVVPYSFEGLKVTTETINTAPVQGHTMKIGKSTSGGDHTIISKPSGTNISSEKINVKVLLVLAMLFMLVAIASLFLIEIPDSRVDIGTNLTIDQSDLIGEDGVFRAVQQYPFYPGGKEAFQLYVQEQIKNSSLTFSSGTVYISAVIGINGEIVDANIIKGLGPLENDFALKIIRNVSDFVPGKKDGASVKVETVLKVDF